MHKLDVTNKIEFGSNDDENLPINKCICGKLFDSWVFVIGIDEEDAGKCPDCGRKFIFSVKINIYELKN